jgi:hypothetical protein
MSHAIRIGVLILEISEPFDFNLETQNNGNIEAKIVSENYIGSKQYLIVRSSLIFQNTNYYLGFLRPRFAGDSLVIDPKNPEKYTHCNMSFVRSGDPYETKLVKGDLDFAARLLVPGRVSETEMKPWTHFIGGVRLKVS